MKPTFEVEFIVKTKPQIGNRHDIIESFTDIVEAGSFKEARELVFAKMTAAGSVEKYMDELVCGKPSEPESTPSQPE